MPVDQTEGSFFKTFRSRSRRGDENGPKCGNCSRLWKHCRWGLKASFHPSRMTQLSPSDSANLSEIESVRKLPNNLRFVDETKEIEGDYDRHDGTLVLHKSSQGNADDIIIHLDAHNRFQENASDRYTISPGTQTPQLSTLTVNEDSQNNQEMAIPSPQSLVSLGNIQNPSSQSPSTDDSLTFGNYLASNNTPLIHVPRDITCHRSSSGTPSQGVLVWPINNYIKADLLSLYFRETSQWCEVTSSLKPFSTLYGHFVIESQAFAAAAVALASIQSLKSNSNSILLARELYKFARETLQRLKSDHHEGALLGTTILCVYSAASEQPIEESTILHECSHLLQTATSSTISDGVLSACFWTFARQDIWAAYAGRRSTLIPLNTWRVAQDEALRGLNQDTYSNRAIFITAKVIDELSREPSGLSENKLRNLWTELQNWVVERPQNVRCIIEVEASGDSTFPIILFSNTAAACGNMYYHVASILLLATGKISCEFAALLSPVCHARRILGISITNIEHATLVNSIHPVCIAAKQIATSIEKIAILNHLKKIEDDTGWKTKTCILDLEQLWGL
ncbi:hypothetical protein BTUL_0184g00320 [Botrytis tulipae]|uniref:Zn(2)-C6 fungal-type domain-containing protein n=1 Tax=Botrytis tulipae TaxID=87230 RepID=A0A4Z1EA00_9HELO|nr:hypothetical protein BTUL_0184g00320 [Botrytis tulipae]